jgi:DNA-binding CsgD family transcriptional regulator
LEREGEIAELGAAIERAHDGAGAVVIVEGPPGIGKTALLGTARGLARTAGSVVLSARGSELERDFAFGVARQLFQAPINAMEADERRQALAGAASLAGTLLDVPEGEAQAGADGEIFPVLHGLHWLCANLAQAEPLVLIVDDAHWADEPSLRFLQYLAGRIDELPLLVLVAARSTQPEAPVATLEAARFETATTSLTLHPLSEDAAASVVAATFGSDGDPAFTRASWEASGGNPLLLTELSRSLAAEGFEPTAEATAHIDQVDPEPVSRSVLSRIARMGPEAQEFARWVAVLGDGTSIGTAAAVATLDQKAALAVADVLAAGHVLNAGMPLSFTHPLIRSAVYGELGAGERSRRHAAAALHLRAAGAPMEQVATHILRTEEGADPDASATLRAAAADAVSRGAPQTAVTLLERALAEATSGAEHHGVLRALAEASMLVGDRRALDWADQAIETAPDHRSRAQTVLSVSWMSSARTLEGGFLDRVLALVDELESDDPELAARLEVHAYTVATTTLDFQPALRERTERWALQGPASTGVQRSRLVLRAGWGAVLGTMPADTVLELFSRVSIPELYRESGGRGLFWLALEFQAHAGAPSLALEAADFAVAEATRRGYLALLQSALGHRTFLHMLEGDIDAAVSDARAAIEIDSPATLAINGGLIFAAATRALTERGDLDDAAELSGSVKAAVLGAPRNLLQVGFRDALARLELARGEPRAALAELDRLRELLPTDWTGGGTFHWGEGAALALRALGEADRARDLADENLKRAREFGAPRVIGVGLRTRGMVLGGQAGIDDLRESVAVLEAGEARLEYAKSLVELGAALRRANRRQDAREPLRRGQELAQRCGARGLAQRSRTELEATGARPRSVVLSGAEALTPSERRVAQLAAQGLTNREIAQQLFVTMKTVETHLRHCYQKLEISGRGELSNALAAQTA